MKILRAIAAVGMGAAVALSLIACAPKDNASYTVGFTTPTLSLVSGDETLGKGTLEAEVLRDEEPVYDVMPAFTVADPSVATVDEAGVVTAVGYGKTTVTATYHDATAIAEVNVYVPATAEEVNSFSEEAVNLYGRTYEKQGAVHFDNPVTGFEVSFLGDKLTANVTVEDDVYVCIYVDGSTKSNRVQLSTATAFPLAEGLGAGIHTVRVLKSSEVDRGGYALNALEAPSFLRAQEKPDLKIEFIGDSITAGYGNLVHGGTWSVENSDACASYAYLTAQKLNADFSVVALSGIAVKAYAWDGTVNMTEMHTYTSLRTKEPFIYDADTDIVVLNLGTNDGSYIDSNPSYGGQFRTDYKDFLTHLKEIYPKAHILCIYGMMGKNSVVDVGIRAVIKQLADDKIVYLNSFRKSDAGANGHPDSSAHILYANELSAYIQENILA